MENIIKPSNTLINKLNQFSGKQQDIIFQNSSAFQLTEGCSIGCSDCGNGAIPKVRDYVSPKEIEHILKNNKKQLINMHTLCFASDPFDYDFEGQNYLDIHKMFAEIVRKSPQVITAFPEGKEKMILEFMLKDNSLMIGDWLVYPVIDRISIMKNNYNRIAKSFQELEGYKIEDQIQTINFEIKDWGQDNLLTITDKNIANKLKDPNFFVKESQGKTAYIIPYRGTHILTIDRPVEFLDIMKHIANSEKQEKENPFHHHRGTRIYDFYSKNLPKNQIHSLRVGQKHLNDLSNQGIGCFHGVVLTPKGIYAYQTTTPSKEEPLGYKKTEITPENFEVPVFSEIWDYSNRRYFYSIEPPKLTGENWFKDKVSKIKKELLTNLPI